VTRRAALLGTLLFVALVPATAIGWVPCWITGWRVGPPLLGVTALRWLGGLLILLALPIFADFLLRFVRARGTPAPLAPPEELVVAGGFARCRNPGYVAVVSLVAGQALLFGSAAVLLYAAALALGFHLFVVLVEEPGLRRRFGPAYEAYCREVPRWLPRLRSGARS
jgi:protein-S-isoprenylcysteine O-methyltransferase Ste14